MERLAYVSLTYLQTFTAAELGLPDDCSDRELEDAAEARTRELIEEYESINDFALNDIEVDTSTRW